MAMTQACKKNKTTKDQYTKPAKKEGERQKERKKERKTIKDQY